MVVEIILLKIFLPFLLLSLLHLQAKLVSACHQQPLPTKYPLPRCWTGVSFYQSFRLMFLH